MWAGGEVGGRIKLVRRWRRGGGGGGRLAEPSLSLGASPTRVCTPQRPVTLGGWVLKRGRGALTAAPTPPAKWWLFLRGDREKLEAQQSHWGLGMLSFGVGWRSHRAECVQWVLLPVFLI